MSSLSSFRNYCSCRHDTNDFCHSGKQQQQNKHVVNNNIRNSATSSHSRNSLIVQQRQQLQEPLFREKETNKKQKMVHDDSMIDDKKNIICTRRRIIIIILRHRRNYYKQQEQRTHQEEEQRLRRQKKRHIASTNVIITLLLLWLSLLLLSTQQQPLQKVHASSYPNNNHYGGGGRPGGREGPPPRQRQPLPPMYPKHDRPYPPIPSSQQQRQDPFQREDDQNKDDPSSQLYPPPPGRPPQTRYSSYSEQRERGPPQYPPRPPLGTNNGNLPRPSSSSQAPPSQYTQRTPIDFNFPSVDMKRQEPQSSSSSSTSSSNSSIGRIEIDPITGDAIVRDDADGDDEDDKLLEDQYKKKRRSSTDDEYDTPRHDLVSRYIHRSKYRHKAMVAFSASSMGYTIGYFITKSLLGNKLSKPFASILALTFMVWSILSRGPYGEMARAIGVAVLLLIENSASIRKEYPVGGHLKAMVKASPRQPFPPHTSNPWQYIQEYDDDIAFSMIKSLMAMTLLGCLCGGSLQIPLVPTWMGALVCASVFAYMTTLKDDPKGDLARTVGMKCVALCGEFWQINQELETLSKIQTVIGKIFDKLMILDRKHRIKDKLIAGGSWIYGKISTMIQQVKNDVGDSDFKDVMEQVENVVGTSEGDDDDNKKR